jgi:hypothetical protein
VVSLVAAAWCIECGCPPDVALTIERRGVLAHYGACWDHVSIVCSRARTDVEQIDAQDVQRLLDDQLDDQLPLSLWVPE